MPRRGRPAPDGMARRGSTGLTLPLLKDGAPYAEGVYVALKRAIADGTMKAGERLRETGAC